jgi:hypothetical protein
MAEKPRVKAPKQRAAASSEGSGQRRGLVIAAVIAGVALGAILLAVLLGLVGGGSGGTTDVAGLRSTMTDAGCTLQLAPALPGVHSITVPSGTSAKWNTDPPTSGPHYAIPAVFGIYNEQIDMARLVHNLEHGGIYILYGKDVPASTVDQLRAFYEDHKTGTIMAPLNRLGDKFVLGAWVVDGDTKNGFLAKCTNVDTAAMATFFRTLQFRGPERFPQSQLLPGM